MGACAIVMDKKELYRLWAYDEEVKMWADMKETTPERYAKAIDNIQKSCEEKRDELLDYILTVEDSYYRMLLTFRCMNRKGWKWIANKLGGSPESHRAALRRFIESTDYGQGDKEQP